MALIYPQRLQVHMNLTTLFEAITYTDFDATDFDMTGRVFRGRGVFGDETEVPAVSILEAPIPNESKMAPGDGTDAIQPFWELVIQGFVRDDKMNPTDPAHILMAQVKQALALERRKRNWRQADEGILGLGRIVEDLYIGGGVVRPADELSSKAYFWLTLGVKLIEDMADPYSG